MSWIERQPRWVARLAVLVAGIGLALAFSSGARAGVDCVANPGDCEEVSIVIVGTGQGSIEEFVDGSLHDTALDCNYFALKQTGTCSELVPPGSHVGLRASPAAGSEFVGWSVLGEEHTHGCGQEVYCIAHVGDNDVTVFAQFDAVSDVSLIVIKRGSAAAQGVVASAPVGIACGLDCTDSFPSNSTVTLSATAPSGVTFAGWGGDCAAFGANPTCVLAMTEGRDVEATFTAATFPLSISIVGQGRVSSLPQAGIACPSVCTGTFVSNTQTVLVAVPSSGWQFTGWSGAGCTGTFPCAVTMFQGQSVTATFSRTAVDAHVVQTKIRYSASGLRVLRVGIDPDEIVTVTLTLRRGSVILQQKVVRNVTPAALKTLTMTLRQGISSGRATLQVLFTNTAGTQKLEVRNVKIPPRLL